MAIQRTPEEYKAAYLHHKSQGNLDKAKRVANLYRQTLQQPQETDNAFQYSIDQAQGLLGKSAEVAGKLVGNETIQNYGTEVVAQQEQDMAQGGYQSPYPESIPDNYKEGGIGQAIKATGTKIVENAAPTISVMAGTALTGLASAYSAPAALLIGGGTALLGTAFGIGEAANEQEEKTGDYDAALATGQGVIMGILERFGAVSLFPKASLKNITGKQLVETLTKNGKADAAKQVIKKMGIEGATEVAQEGVSIAGAASKGGEYTQKEITDRAADSFILGSANAGVIQTVQGGASLVRGKPANLSDRAAQATFAQRLDALAREGNSEGKEFNLSDLDTSSVTGVRALMDLAHSKISSEITNLEKDLSQYLNTNDKSLTSQQKSDRERVKKMLQQARNKTKSVVGKSDFELLQELVSGSADGKRLVNLVKESQEQTKVWNAGMKGGVSKFTDNANPLPQSNNYSGQAALTNAIRGVSAAGVAGATAGASIPYQIGAVVGGRLIDGVTGRRSKVRRYIKRNAKNKGMAPVYGLGEQDKNLAKAKAASQKAADKAEAKRQADRDKAFFMYNQGSPPNPNSPEGIYQRFTGMDRAGLEATIADALADPNLDPGVRQDLESLIESMKYGERVSGYVVRYINGLADQNPEIGNRRVRPIEPPEGLDTAIAINNGSGRTPRQQGKFDNNQVVMRLKEELKNDVSLTQSEKEAIDSKLDEMLLDLGQNPVSTMEAIEKALLINQVPEVAVAKYITSYKNRVIQQQQGRTGGDTPPPSPTPPTGGTPTILGPDGQPIRPVPPVVQPEPEPPTVDPVPETAMPEMPQPIDMPTPQGIKDQLPNAQGIIKIFDIGNKGSVWENGISNVDDFLALGKALNLSIEISQSQAAFDRYRKSLGLRSKKGLQGFHLTKKDDPNFKPIIGVKASKKETDLDVLTTLAHEISHTIEGRSPMYGAMKKLKQVMTTSAHRDSKDRDYILEGSFREKLNQLVADSQKKDATEAQKEIVKEIDYIQNQLLITFAGNPSLGKGYARNYSYKREFFKKILRETGEDISQTILTPAQRKAMKSYKDSLPVRARNHISYVTDSAEYAVDPLWVYLANPKLMKEVAPETAKFIQEYFKTQSKAFPVSFHANPMATILAIVMAGMVAKERDEEEEEQVQQRPPIQPLQQGQGILSV
jgi:hypothetical protein